MMSLSKLWCFFTVICFTALSFSGDQPANASSPWNLVASPFRPMEITAQDKTLWVCGADEMILSSKDGGATWETDHQNRDGETLLDISFVNEKIGFAQGTGGLLLSTEDGGQTWKSHIVPGTMRAFSFADAQNGIAVIGEGPSGSKVTSIGQALPLQGSVKITHDGGGHWEDIPALNSEDLRSFSQTISIAALDSLHFLMLRRQPGVEDIFVITKDGGKSWNIIRPQNDASTRELPRMVYIHQGEYWAFGYELIHREQGGGYGVPLTLHSKDGETWVHGAQGPKEFDSCTSQGCYMWDGAIEILYGEHEQFWTLPQDGSLGNKWAIADEEACTIDDGSLKCGHATLTEKPPDRPESAGGIIHMNATDDLVDGCIECQIADMIPDNPGATSAQKVRASLEVRRDGTVSNVSVDFPSSKRLSNEISVQLSKWLFEPDHKGTETVETKKDISLLLACSGFPGRPETTRCWLRRPR
jgi:photosystem II stability/assembly factor-like uncharacterized protein